jgi:pSer/pThr/pTyr-binding forkhead associated (FHA) protein/predicted Ser/Thr protein kinase
MPGEQLLVTEGAERGKRLSVEEQLLIGRSAPEDEGRLGGDRELSRRHGRIARDPDGNLTVEDFRSSNGTFVNGEPVTERRTLRAGDQVKLGTTVLEVTADEPAASAAAADELVITAGAASGRRLAIGDELVIGRAVDGEGRLAEDRELSRRHARIARDAQRRLTIEDLGSANGTLVNGRAVSGQQVLEPGDTVRLGSTTLELPGGKPVPPAAPPQPEPRAAPPPRPAPAPRAPAPPAPPAPAPAPAAAPAVVANELRRGAVFAGCRVEEKIGHGDMGVVYSAEELALQRQVALKLILPEHSAEERFRERFRRESMTAAAIDHPNVIPILDAGDEEGVLYITMRLVEGTDLRELIAEEGALDPQRATRITRQVAAALDAAHARGLLHRDVKPPNVLLGRDEHVYLSDFGLAKRTESVGGMTRQGSIVARAQYVAPEQILNEPVDARADIYALGCLLFESLTGEPPFARWKEGPEALAHLNAPVPSILQHRPDLPAGFEEVIRTAMAKDPGERYTSAGDLGQAALVAAGGQRQAPAWSVVATGDAALFGDGQTEESAAAGGEAGPKTLQWAVAIAGLVVVAVGMAAALAGISSL